MIKHILEDSLNIKKKASKLIFLQCLITYFLIILILNLINITNNKVSQLETATKTLYKVTDNFVNEKEKQLFNQSDNVSVLKNFYEWEKHNDLFTYIICNQQNVGKEKDYFPSIFEIGYEVGQETLGTYKSLQVNNNFLNHFSISVSEGRLFNTNDYSSDNKTIPIILGHDYKTYCELNERITLYYMGKELNCEVIGFLPKDSYYNNGYDLKLLDRYIILPSLEINSDPSLNTCEKSFELKLYLDKCSGYLYSNYSAAYLQNIISDKCYDLDIVPYSIEGTLNFYPSMWGLEGKALLEILIIFVTIVLITSILCISMNMSSKISLLKKNYAILIANGLEAKVIFQAVALEIILINFISLILATLLAHFIIGQILLAYMVIICIFICIISYIYPFILLKTIRITDVLRGDD